MAISPQTSRVLLIVNSQDLEHRSILRRMGHRYHAMIPLAERFGYRLRDSLKLNFPRMPGILQSIIDWRDLYGID